MNDPDAASRLRSDGLRATAALVVLISLALGASPGIQPALARLSFGGGVGVGGWGPEGILLMIGRRPTAAFGNSTGDRQMLEYTKAGLGTRLSMLVLHDDAKREYAYGPAQGLPDTRVGKFTQALYDEAKKKGWIVISMKNDWKQIFSFER